MFGNNLRKIRKEKKIGQVELAKKLNVANGTISMWENNLRTPDLITIKEIAKFFSVPISFLIEDENEKQPEQIEPEEELTKEQRECVKILKTLPPKQVEQTYYFLLGLSERSLEIMKRE